MDNLDYLHEQIKIYTWVSWGIIPVLFILGGLFGGFLNWLSVGALVHSTDLAFLVGAGSAFGAFVGGIVNIEIQSTLSKLKSQQERALNPRNW